MIKTDLFTLEFVMKDNERERKGTKEFSVKQINMVPCCSPYAFTGRKKKLITNLEKGSNVHIKAEISESSRDDLGTSVVSILTHLRHQDTRTTAFLLYKGLGTTIAQKQI